MVEGARLVKLKSGPKRIYRKATPVQDREKDILLACRKYLDLRHITYRRIHTQAVLRNGFFSPNRDMAGMSDLVIFLPQGKSLWVEVKASDGVQSDGQRAFADDIQFLGHTYAIIRSLPELVDLLELNGVEK